MFSNTGPVQNTIKKYHKKNIIIASTLNDKFCGEGHPFPLDRKENSVKNDQEENNLVEACPLCVCVCVCVCVCACVCMRQAYTNYITVMRGNVCISKSN